MKAVVEFGRPQSALPAGAPCGVSGHQTCESLAAANHLALHLRHVLGNRQHEYHGPDDFLVSRDNPRIVWWANDHSCWVAVTIFKPNYEPGPYAAQADKFAKIAKEL
jgi:hypothetical protein